MNAFRFLAATLLQHFYATGDNEILLKLLARFTRPVDQMLQVCIPDREVILEIWKTLVLILRQSCREPELRFDLSRGPVRGYMLATAGYLAYRWLVEMKEPRDLT